jgi:aminoglycoside phosphotransferase (APT) family kinase protein
MMTSGWTAGSAGGATAEIPSGIDGVTPQWLTGVLDSATVSDVRVERIALDSGFSSQLYRAHLSGEGVPNSVIVKLPAESAAGDAMKMLGGYAREVAFYRYVAGHAPLGTPRVYAARIDENSDFVLVLEDLRDWDNADHLAGLSLDRARCCIAQLAGLHAWSVKSTNADALEAFPSIDTPMTRDMLPAAFEPAWRIYRDNASAPVPPAVEKYAQRFAEFAPQAMDALSERSMLIHGDIRADNMFFSAGDLKVVDFQLAARGAGATDIGYLASQGLPTEVRRGRDEALVREYLERLAEHGVTDYSFDEAWRHYRFAAAYFVVLPAMPLLSWDALPERSRQLCMRLVERAVANIDETEAMEVFV